MGTKAVGVLILLGFTLLLPGFAGAQDKPQLVLKISAQKEVIVKDQNGRSRTAWIEVQSFEPGDVLKYVITYKNQGNAEARNAVIVDPIPAGTTYIANSAEGEHAEITFSVDGRTFQLPPMLRYRVKAPGTPEQLFSATPEMYTHIKWMLTAPTPPGGSGTVSFKVRVS